MAPSISQIPPKDPSLVTKATTTTTTTTTTTPEAKLANGTTSNTNINNGNSSMSMDPISVTDLFSTESRSFTGSALKATAIQSRHDFIPLGIGRPSAELYPWKDGDISSYFGGLEAPAPIPSAPVQEGGARQNGTAITSTAPATGRSLETISNEAFTYGPTPGVSEVVQFLAEHVREVHEPQYTGWRTCLSTGSTAGIEISLRIFCNRGDPVLVEDKTYSGVMEAMALIGLEPVPVGMDEDGLRADLMDEILSSWDDGEKNGPKPKVLYTIPTGQNPTGITQPTTRREQVYAVAQKHNLIIIEDDPYVYLQMGKYNPSPDPLSSSSSSTTTTTNKSNKNSNGNSNHRHHHHDNDVLPKSYLSLDTAGRVIRLDSTSKIMAPGLRAGWVTSSEQIITKFLAYTENTCGIVSGVTQLLLYNLLCRRWGHQGFRDWLDTLSATYRRRRDAVVRTCLRELPMVAAAAAASEVVVGEKRKRAEEGQGESEGEGEGGGGGEGGGKAGGGNGVCRFRIPEQGMFLWIYIDVSRHAGYQEIITSNTTTTHQQPQEQMAQLDEKLRAWRAAFEARLVADSLANGVQVTRGGLFQLGHNSNSSGTQHEVCIRMTFAAAKEAELEEGARRFAEVVRRHFP